MLLLGLVALSLSLAKPAVAEQVADEQAVVVLAMDTSLSMEADRRRPLPPGRRAGRGADFLENVPDGVRVGLVGFDNGARLLVPPTDKTAVIERAIDRLDLGEGTAIGEAVFTSLDAIDRGARRRRGSRRRGRVVGAHAPPTTASSRPRSCCCPTARTPSGARTRPRRRGGPGPARSTVAVGTDSGSITLPDGSRSPCRSNRPALADLADKTGARSFTAYSSDELRQVYEDLGRTLTEEPVAEGQRVVRGGAMVLLAPRRPRLAPLVRPPP